GSRSDSVVRTESSKRGSRRRKIRLLRQGRTPLRLCLRQAAVLVVQYRQVVAGLVALQAHVEAGEMGAFALLQQMQETTLRLGRISCFKQQQSLLEQQLAVLGIMPAPGLARGQGWLRLA